MRVSFTFLAFVAGVLLTVSLHRDNASQQAVPVLVPPLADPTMTISFSPLRLSIVGTSASAFHENALQRQAVTQFENAEVYAEFFPGVVIGEDWVVTSIQLLQAVASMASAEAQMSTGSVEIRGVTAEPVATAARIEILRELMPVAAELHTDIIVIRSAETLGDLCRKAFPGLILGPISFAQSSAELRLASFATLDRITDFAHDCPSVTIVITGHTDSSGDESWNRQLSLARAQAVADRIARNGIDAQRLIVVGAGSSEPIADNATAYGRELNRRIEFELR